VEEGDRPMMILFRVFAWFFEREASLGGEFRFLAYFFQYIPIFMIVICWYIGEIKNIMFCKKK
jgi:hypothetical protein